MYKIAYIIIILGLISCNKSIPKETSVDLGNDSLRIAENIINKEISENLINEITYHSINEISSIRKCENVLFSKRDIAINVLDNTIIEYSNNLNETDHNFIKNQLLAKEIYKWNNGNFKNKKVISPEFKDSITKSFDEIWKDFYKKYDCILYISKPIFNKLKNKAVIEIQFEDKIEFYLLTKENNKWNTKQLNNSKIID